MTSEVSISHETEQSRASELVRRPETEAPKNRGSFLSELGGRVLRTYMEARNEKGEFDALKLVQGMGESLREYKERVAKADDPVIINPPESKSYEPDRGVWSAWCGRIGEAASSGKEGIEPISHLLQRAVASLQERLTPELTPLTAGSVSWKTKFGVKQPILDALITVHDTRFTNTSETNEDFTALVTQVAQLVPEPQRTAAITQLLTIQAGEQVRLKANEPKGGFSPEFPKTPEEYAEIVRNAIIDFVDTDVLENITHGWQNKIVVTSGVLMKYKLGDKEIESDPVARTPITLRDSKGAVLETIPLYEYLRREVDAAESFTLTAYSWKTCATKDKVANVVGIDIPNKGLDALGNIMTTDLKTNIGDKVGEVFSVYCRMAKKDKDIIEELDLRIFESKTNEVLSGENANFFTEQGVPRQDEKKTRELVRSTYLGTLSKEDQTYVESLALNLAYAWGYSSEASSTGTMSATERSTYLDRVFKTNVWRNVKKHSGGPRSTIGSDIYPKQLLMPAPELFTIEEPVDPKKPKGEKIYRTLDSKLKESKYKFRDVGFLSMPEIDKRFDVFILDGVSYFEDMIASPSDIKAEWKDYHKVAEHAENALNPALVMAQIEGSNVDGLKKADVDKLVQKRKKDLTIETFRGLRKEAEKARMFKLAGDIQIVCNNVTGVVI